MSEIIKAPWNPDQVQSLNEYQGACSFHPFTCGEHDPDSAEHPLEATPDGWFCPKCKANGKSYSQNWCHFFMADWSWKQMTIS
jgi:rubredoxin